MNKRNDYCVYLHRLKNTNEVFYIGQGTKERSRSRTNRNFIWSNFACLGYDIEILRDNLTKQQAIDIEAENIQNNRPIANIKVNDRRVKYDYEVLSKYFKVDPKSVSGLSWNVRIMSGRNNEVVFKEIGQPAGSIDYSRYKLPQSWRVQLNNQRFQVHRIIWLLTYKYIDEDLVIDHLDGNPLNNLISNLEMKTQVENTRNRKPQSENTGVCAMLNRGKTQVYTYRATWTDHTSCVRHKDFNVSEYGEDAQKLAIAYRFSKLKELESFGVVYSDRHLNIQQEPEPVN